MDGCVWMYIKDIVVVLYSAGQVLVGLCLVTDE